MELSPQSVSSTTFKIVKKGYDPDEVRAYLSQLAGAIEQTQSQAAAMEARARAAVVRLQEIAAQTPDKTGAGADVAASEEAETISRTLLLAQRTADSTVAEAKVEAGKITTDAEADARLKLAGAQEQATRLVEDARSEARRAGEAQRVQVESEVQALLARREFLLSDVDYLEQFIVTQRDRLRDVAGSLTDMVERVPGGLGDLRRPLVSAVGQSVPDLPPSSAAATVVDDGSQLEAPAAQDDTMPMERVDVGGNAADSVFADPPSPVAEEMVAGADGAEGEVVEVAENAEVVGESDGASEDAAVTDSDPTPPSGVASRFLFEDITAEVPAVDSEKSN